MPSQRSSLQAYRIACLECHGSCLYAEVVQISDPPVRYWLRPLWLSVASAPSSPPPSSSCPPSLYRVQGCSDLLWQQASLRDALDTEILPFLAEFPVEDAAAIEPSSEAKQQLDRFLHQLWQHQTTSSLPTDGKVP